jgi:hypothetical protein
MTKLLVTNIIDAIQRLKIKSKRHLAEAKSQPLTPEGQREAIYLVGKAQAALDAANELQAELIQIAKVEYATPS